MKNSNVLSIMVLLALVGAGCTCSGTVLVPTDGGPTNDGGTTLPDGGPNDGGTTLPDGGPSDGGTTLPDGGVVTAVTMFGIHGTRDSLYVDEAFTKARLATLQTAGGLVADQTFAPAIVGDVYASPLFLENGLNGKDVLYVATEENNVYAIDAATGTVLWHTALGAAAPLSQFGCGNIDPVGITGTPVLDIAYRELVLVGTVDVGGAPHHTIYGLSIDTGDKQWSIDLDNAGIGFDTKYQGQRAGLLLLNDVVYIAFGGYYGDCGTNWGYVMGLPLATAPNGLYYYRTPGQGGAIWAPNGIATDGTSVFAVTGNGEGSQATWADGDSDALLRLDAAHLTFSGQPQDYFAFNEWASLSSSDADFGSNGTTLFELQGAGSGQLALCIGKQRNAYLIDRANMGGIQTPDHPLAQLGTASTIASDASGGMATYQTPSGRYVAYTAVCDNQNDTLGVLKVSPGTPPTLTEAFCVSQGVGGEDNGGSPIVTTSDGTNDAVLWGMGAGSGGDGKLHGVDGDTGASIITSTAMPGVIHWVAPLVAKGSIYVPANGTVYAFRVQ
jgi:outer membrane protein assembly factor BamB